MTYKFIDLTRQEVEAMIGVTFQETRVYRDAKEEGRQEGHLALVQLLLAQKLGKVSLVQMKRVQNLSLEELERLAIALLRFDTKRDLKDWLDSV